MAIQIILVYAIMLIMTLVALKYFYEKIYLVYKNSVYDSSFEELIVILQTVIQTELDAYSNDIFLNKGSITNANFENFYNDITSKIVANLSPKLVFQLSKYISDEMVYRLIARSVKKYLTERINGTI